MPSAAANMTNPVFIYQAGPFGIGQKLLLSGPEGRHAATVKRITVGQSLDLIDGLGARANCRVVAARPTELDVVVLRESREPPAQPQLTLVQALAKGDRAERAIEAATELGVHRIVPWQAERSIVQWRGERAVKSHQKWQQIVSSAAKQARRAWIPPVDPLSPSPELLARITASTCAVVLHESAEQPLGEILRAADLAQKSPRPTAESPEILFLVGPEGGISDPELIAFTAAGAHPARLGPHVLRSSTAGPTALAVWGAVLGWR